MSLEALSKLVEDGETEDAQALAQKLLQDGTDPLEMIAEMTRTMARVGDLFSRLEIFLPEIMLAGEALSGVGEVMAPYLEAVGGQEVKGKIVIGAAFIGVSSLMTTTMPRQKEIIEILKAKGIRDQYKVVIGGAPTSQMWADQIGADLYCREAKDAPELMANLLAG